MTVSTRTAVMLVVSMSLVGCIYRLSDLSQRTDSRACAPQLRGRSVAIGLETRQCGETESEAAAEAFERTVRDAELFGMIVTVPDEGGSRPDWTLTCRLTRFLDGSGALWSMGFLTLIPGGERLTYHAAFTLTDRRGTKIWQQEYEQSVRGTIWLPLVIVQLVALPFGGLASREECATEACANLFRRGIEDLAETHTPAVTPPRRNAGR